MKAINKLYGTLIFLLGLFLVLPSAGCNSDDDDDGPVAETFLELYDGTKWIHVEDGITVYLRLSDNLQVPIEMWVSEVVFEKGDLANECFYYSKDWVEEGVEITENSRNRFTISYMEMESWSFTVQNEKLIVTYTDAGGQEPPIMFEKTTANLDALEICPEDLAKPSLIE